MFASLSSLSATTFGSKVGRGANLADKWELIQAILGRGRAVVPQQLVLLWQLHNFHAKVNTCNQTGVQQSCLAFTRRAPARSLASPTARG